MPEKGLLTRTYFVRDQVLDCPNFTRAKNKLPSWDKYSSHRHKGNMFPKYFQSQLKPSSGEENNDIAPS